MTGAAGTGCRRRRAEPPGPARRHWWKRRGSWREATGAAKPQIFPHRACSPPPLLPVLAGIAGERVKLTLNRRKQAITPLPTPQSTPNPAGVSPFAALDMAPRDPILGVTERFNADPNPRKVNLGVGVYYDDEGKVPLLECVQRVERRLADKGLPHSYLPIDGLQAYD